MKEFEGQVAIVTGTTGIGRAIANRLAAGGAEVVACGIEADANGLYGVSVLNLGSITSDPQFPNQDQLILTPGYQATTGDVADGGGATMTLLGGALLALGLLHSRRVQAA